MSKKNEEVVDRFLESHNMDYFYCILADKEAERLSILPDSIKKTFPEKVTTLALKHIALNDVPDYIVDELEMEKKPLDDDEYPVVEEVQSDDLRNYADDDDDDEYADEYDS